VELLALEEDRDADLALLDRAPAGWRSIVEYAAGNAPRPDADEAWRVLTDLLDAFDIDRCEYRREVVNALLHRAPLRLAATGFSFRGEGVSYQTTAAHPHPGVRSDERVTIMHTGPPDARLDFSHTRGQPRADDDRLLVRLEPGDWVSYDVVLDQPARLAITVGGEAPQVRLRIDDTGLDPTDSDSGAAGLGTTTTPPLPAGAHTIRVTATAPALLDGAVVDLAV
jgi:endoglucanase